MALTKIRCVACAHSETIAVENVLSSNVKDRILDGTLFRWTCPECGRENLLSYPLFYFDSAQGLVIVLSDEDISSKETPAGYTGRVVSSVGDLIEKIKIFDSGLDDIVVELCKYITLNEMGKELSLKFLRLDGADSELIFAYPEDGQMNMLAVGMNVYEDCYGIVRRSPELRDLNNQQLLKIDSDFICGLMVG